MVCPAQSMASCKVAKGWFVGEYTVRISTNVRPTSSSCTPPHLSTVNLRKLCDSILPFVEELALSTCHLIPAPLHSDSF